MEAYKATQNQGIKIYECCDKSRLAVDELFEELEILVQDTSNYHFVLVDMLESGAVPMKPLSEKLEKLMHNLEGAPNLKIAIVMSDTILVDMASAMLRTITRRTHIQYFTNLDSAYHWLNLEKQRQFERRLAS